MLSGGLLESIPTTMSRIGKATKTSSGPKKQKPPQPVSDDRRPRR